MNAVCDVCPLETLFRYFKQRGYTYPDAEAAIVLLQFHLRQREEKLGFDFAARA
jgi:hypothetical protein